MGMSNEDLLYEANRIIGVLCDRVSDMPCGCEFCPLYQEDENLCDKERWENEYRGSEVDNGDNT